MSLKIDLTGKKFSRLLVIRDSRMRTLYGKILWLCLCDCGRITLVSGDNLKNNHTKSCGCLLAEFLRRLGKKQTGKQSPAFKHGESPTPANKGTKLYWVWRKLISRCYFKKDPKYKYYGKRGIAVCNEWRNNYLSFKKWILSAGYKNGLQIHRIDSSVDYEPSNCCLLKASEHSKKTLYERWHK